MDVATESPSRMLVVVTVKAYHQEAVSYYNTQKCDYNNMKWILHRHNDFYTATTGQRSQQSNSRLLVV